MRILWIARTCPYPPNDGEKLRVFNLIKHLSDHEITLVFRVMHDNELDGIAVLQKYCRQVKYVYIPSPASNYTRVKWCLPFLFSKYPLSLATVYFREIAEIIQELCSCNIYDIVQVEHSSLTVYLDHVRFIQEPAKIVTLHNIDYIRNQRILDNLPLGIPKLYLYLNQLRFKNWEMLSLNRYDRVIVMSETDKKEIMAVNNTSRIDVVPNGVDVNEYKPAIQNSESDMILFVASMDSESNHDAAIYFLKEIFPLVKKKYPGAMACLVGRKPRKELMALNNDNDIVVTGEVTDVLEYYQHARVSIVPLRSGGGTRLKILEAMAVGVPVASTSIGCEGLNVENGRHLLVADEPSAFAAAIIRLFEDATFCRTLAASARRLVEEQYDWEIIAHTHDQVYRALTNQP